MLSGIQFMMFMMAELLSGYGVKANPHPMVTPAPAIASQIARRELDDGPNTFGYISGDANKPLGCAAGYHWSAIVAFQGFGACCNEVTCTDAIFGCVDNGTLNPCETDSESCSLLTTISCDAPKPSCFQYILMTDAQDQTPFYLPRCGTASTEVQVFVKATNRAQATQSLDGISDEGESNTRTQDSASSTGSRGAKPSTQPTSDSNQKNDGSSKDDSKRTYIIAGIIGGLVIVVLATGVGIYMHRHHEKKKARIEPKQLRSDISTLPSDYASNASNYGEGRNPILDNPAKRDKLTAWSEGVSSTSSSYGGDESMPPTSQNIQYQGGGFVPANSSQWRH